MDIARSTWTTISQILKRRGWMIAVPARSSGAGRLQLTSSCPPQYVSQTLILVEQQKVPDELRQAGRRRGHHRSPGLDEGADPEPLAPAAHHRAVQPLRHQRACRWTTASKRPARTSTSSRSTRRWRAPAACPGFFISFKSSDPHTAQQVCGEIASLFVTANLNARAQSVEGTTDFLKSQLADAKRTLDEQDSKLAAFQSKYMGRLPGEEAPNMNMLTSLNTQLDAAHPGARTAWNRTRATSSR